MKNSLDRPPKTNNSALFFLFSITFLAFLPALNNQFVNWDDYTLILENPRVQSLSLSNIIHIFQTMEVRTYIPLTILSFAIEHQFFQYHSFIYHLDNVLLHLIVVGLIFKFALKLGLNVQAAFLAGLLFGVHPMHVESVAWVSERKDVLYSLFYLAALYAYWTYLETRRGKSYFLSVLFTLLSILAKPMAYSLPVVLLFCDWLYGRKFSGKMFLDKVPHFLIVLTISLFTFTSNATTINYRPGEVLLIWIWNFCFYLHKFFLPLDLNPIYALPEPISLFNFSYALALVTLSVLLWALWRYRNNRWLIIAVFLYAVPISFIVIRSAWDFGNRTVAADRFMYLPSLGICLLFGFLADHFLRKTKQPGVAAVAGLFLLLILKTTAQSDVWQDGLSLWNTVLKNNPKLINAYLGRAVAYGKQGNLELAMADYTKAIAVDPANADGYLFRGIAYEDQENWPMAIADYQKAIELNPKKTDVYFYLAQIYDTLGEDDQAFANYTKVIEIDPQYAKAYNNRGYIYLLRGQYDLALPDFETALKIDPLSAEVLNNIGVFHFQQGQHEDAVIYFTKAMTVNSKFPDAYVNRANLYAMTGQYKLAFKDIERILVIDPDNGRAFFTRGNLYRDMKQYNNAIEDYNKAIALDPHNDEASRQRALIYPLIH